MYSLLNDNPVIAAVKEDEFLDAAVDSEVYIIFMLKANIITIKEQLEKAHRAGKLFYVHIDMAEGIGKDSAGVLYLKSIGVDGIITTRAGIVKAAKDNGLKTVLRVFILDTRSIHSSLETIKNSKPDMVEIMPGIMPKIIKTFAEKLKIPVIAGGLIEEKSEYYNAINSGAAAISTSKTDFWE